MIKKFKREVLKVLTGVALTTGIVFCGFSINDTFTPAFADEQEEYNVLENGLRYVIKDNSYAVIVGYNGKEDVKSVTVPDMIDGYSVKEIGDGAFVTNYQLENVYLPQGITTIGEYAFSECESLKSMKLPDSVTCIKEGAFNKCSSLKSINLPEGLTEIADETFFECEKLSGIVLPKNLKKVGVDAFGDCAGITSIVIPGKVETLCDGAFYGTSISTIKIPASVKMVEPAAFAFCNNLKSIVVDKNNKIYDSQNNCNAIVRTKDSVIVAGCNNTVIYNSITGIGDGAFCGFNGIVNVVLPDKLKSIGKGAFAYCENLEWIYIPDSVTKIGEDVFYGCPEDFYVMCKEETAAFEYVVEYELLVYPLDHHFYNKITKAKPGANGKIYGICAYCDEKKQTIIYAPKTVVLKNSSFVYNGKQRRPQVNVKDCKGKVIASSNYTVKYINNVNAGTATVKVTFKGSKYTGTLTKTFKITKAKNAIKGSAAYTKKVMAKAQSFKLNAKATSGKLTYKSNNKNVKVDANGKVTIAKKFKGTAIITVTAGNRNYATATKKIKITVR